MKTLRQNRYVGLLWLVLRLWLGYSWLMAGIAKVFGAGNAVWVGPKAGTAVTGFLQGAIAQSPLAPGFDPVKTSSPAVQEWYAQLAQNVFLPNATVFSYLVAYGELLVGLALILGIFTRFSALMGVIMNLSYLLAGANSSNPQMLVVGLAMVMIGGAAVGFYGLDYFVRPLLAKLSQGRLGDAPKPQPQTAS